MDTTVSAPPSSAAGSAVPNRATSTCPPHASPARRAAPISSKVVVGEVFAGPPGQHHDVSHSCHSFTSARPRSSSMILSATSSGSPVSISACEVDSGTYIRRTNESVRAVERLDGRLGQPAGLHRLANFAHRCVPRGLPRGLQPDDRGHGHLQFGCAAAAELLADPHLVARRLDRDDNRGVRRAQVRGKRRRQLAVEVVGRLHAGDHQVGRVVPQIRGERGGPRVGVGWGVRRPSHRSA